MAGDLTYHLKGEDKVATIAFTSIVGMETASELKAMLASVLSEYDSVAVDLSDIEHIDSTGLSCLIMAYKQARQEGKKFRVSAANVRARHVLELARVDKMLMPEGGQ